MKVNDTVRIIAGDNKGVEAMILKIDRKKGLAYLEGIGVVERHVRKSYLNPAGGKKTVHLGIDLSNLKLAREGEAAGKGTTKKATTSTADKKAKKGAK